MEKMLLAYAPHGLPVSVSCLLTVDFSHGVSQFWVSLSMEKTLPILGYHGLSLSQPRLCGLCQMNMLGL